MRALLAAGAVFGLAALVAMMYLLVVAVLNAYDKRKAWRLENDLHAAQVAILTALEDAEEALRLDEQSVPFLDSSTREMLEETAGDLRQRYYKEQPDE